MLLLKIEPSEITPVFYNNFFRFGGGEFSHRSPLATPLAVLICAETTLNEHFRIFVNVLQISRNFAIFPRIFQISQKNFRNSSEFFKINLTKNIAQTGTVCFLREMIAAHLVKQVKFSYYEKNQWKQ